jgi:hypothetical protein
VNAIRPREDFDKLRERVGSINDKIVGISTIVTAILTFVSHLIFLSRLAMQTADQQVIDSIDVRLAKLIIETREANRIMSVPARSVKKSIWKKFIGFQFITLPDKY